MSPKEVNEIWERVKKNQRQLEQCIGPHNFQPIINQRKYRCNKCDGELDAANYYWYYQGLKHGRKEDT